MKNQSSKGFTLIELMMVLTIVAVISAIAIPSYRALTVKTGQKDAQKALRMVQQNAENWRAKALSYQGFNVVSTEYQPGPYVLTFQEEGTSWVALATPNTNFAGRTYRINSQEEQCSAQSGTALTRPLPCTGAGIEKSWN